MDLGSVGRHDALTERLGRNTRGGEKPPDSFISSLLVALVVLVLVLVFARAQSLHRCRFSIGA